MAVTIDLFELASDVIAQVTYPTNGHHPITFVNTAQLDTAEKWKGPASLLVNGNSDYVTIPNSPDWDVCASNSDDWTISFRVKHTDHEGLEVYIGQMVDGTHLWALYHSHGDGMRFFMQDGGMEIDTGEAGEIIDTDWHWVALIKVADKYGIYIDGDQVNYVQDASVKTFTAPLYIGARGVGPDWYFDGHIDEVRISHSNIFGAVPNNVPDDTITPPTEAHETDTDTKLLLHFDGADEAQVTKDASRLDCYSEDTIINEGTYSLKAFAKQTDSLNDTLTRTIGAPIDLSGISIIKFDIYSSRTGANIKIGIHDSGGTTTEKTHTQAGAGGWETVEWDISGVADADKNAIDSIIITVVNADADNTFYLDNMFAGLFISGDAVISGGGSLVSTGRKEALGDVDLSGNGSLAVTGVKEALGDVGVSGSGSVVATGVKEALGIAALSGGGSLVTSGLKEAFGDIGLSGSGSLIAIGIKKFFKAITEGLGKRPTTLRLHKTEAGDGDEDIILIYLSSIWDEISGVSTTWEVNDKREAP